MTNPIIEKLSINEIIPTFTKEPFNDPVVKVKIESLLPKIIRKRISFHLKNANTALANGLKRIISGEMKVKSLDIRIEDIDTNEEFVKYNELRDRINQIPIDQEIPLDTTFAINIINEIGQEWMPVYTNDFKQTNGKPLKGLPFAHTFHISELRPARYLRLSKIYVVEGYGFKYGTFCLTLDIAYTITDYIIVTFMNERSNLIHKRIKVTELLALFKKFKVDYKGRTDEIYLKKILIIPNKSYQLSMNTQTRESLKNFEIIIENPEEVKVTNLYADDAFLKGYQSTEFRAQDFYLEFNTYGNVDPIKMLHEACENIQGRLRKFKEALDDYTKNDDHSKVDIFKAEGFVSVLQDEQKTQILIRGEDHTISQLMKLAIFELDPNIGLINDPLEHPLNRTIILNIMHPQPLKIVNDAIDMNLSHFEKIKKQIKL